MEPSELIVEREAPIAVLRLNRPRRRNALSLDLMRKLIDELRSIASDGAMKVVIVAAEGPVFPPVMISVKWSAETSTLIGRCSGFARI